MFAIKFKSDPGTCQVEPNVYDHFTVDFDCNHDKLPAKQYTW